MWVEPKLAHSVQWCWLFIVAFFNRCVSTCLSWAKHCGGCCLLYAFWSTYNYLWLCLSITSCRQTGCERESRATDAKVRVQLVLTRLPCSTWYTSGMYHSVQDMFSPPQPNDQDNNHNYQCHYYKSANDPSCDRSTVATARWVFTYKKELPSFACIKGLATNYSLVTLIALNSPTAPSLLTAATRMEYWVEGVSLSRVTLFPASPVPATVTLSIPPLEGGL